MSNSQYFTILMFLSLILSQGAKPEFMVWFWIVSGTLFMFLAAITAYHRKP